MSGLKNCPFCGGDNKHSDDCYIPMLVEYVERPLFFENDYEKKLEEAWNTRAESEQDKCNRERLVQIGEAVAKKEPIHFLAGETYVPERTCEVSYEYVGEVFPHSILVKELSCGHEVRIPFSNGEELQDINNCPVCGARVISEVG